MNESEEEFEPPNYHTNINLTPQDVGELDWSSVIGYLFKKNAGQVPIPAFFYEDLLDLCRYNASGFIHYN